MKDIKNGYKIKNMQIMHEVGEVNCKEERKSDIFKMENQITNKYAHELEMKPTNNFKSKHTQYLLYTEKKSILRHNIMLNHRIMKRVNSQ